MLEKILAVDELLGKHSKSMTGELITQADVEVDAAERARVSRESVHVPTLELHSMSVKLDGWNSSVTAGRHMLKADGSFPEQMLVELGPGVWMESMLSYQKLWWDTCLSFWAPSLTETKR